MRMARTDKAAVLENLEAGFRESNAALLTEYRGLTVAQLKQLRRSLAGQAEYAVVKNTLTKLAAKRAGVEGLDDLLEGPSAIAFVQGDAIAVAKSLKAFSNIGTTALRSTR
jgi:large subunit ribosomal protein L10